MFMLNNMFAAVAALFSNICFALLFFMLCVDADCYVYFTSSLCLFWGDNPVLILPLFYRGYFYYFHQLYLFVKKLLDVFKF